MIEEPLWSILICTLASRQDKFMRLMDVLLPQAEEIGEVEIIACHNNGERPLGEIRQALMMDARGKYLSFVDDDDEVPDYFVREMLLALWEDPDVVGFITEYSEREAAWRATVYNSLQYEPHDTPGKLYRDLVHQMPCRAELAKQGDFTRGWPEDNTWRNVVRPLLKTEVYIDKVLYYYRHSWADSVQGQLAPHTYTPRPVIESPVFRWLDS